MTILRRVAATLLIPAAALLATQVSSFAQPPPAELGTVLHQMDQASTKFKSAEAEEMWTRFAVLWKSVNPNSTNYNFMQEPLLAGDVWIGFDHIARPMPITTFVDSPNRSAHSCDKSPAG